MTIDNLIPTPRHIERKNTIFDIKRIETTDKIAYVMNPGEINRFNNYLASEQFQREGYVLATRTNGEIAKIHVYATSPAGFFYGQNTAKRLMQANKGQVPGVLIVDYPSFQIRGFMEGYTGFPWTADREAMIKICAQYGFNAYVLGPNEFNLLSGWRNEFSKAYAEHLASVSKTCHENFVRFAYKIIPFGINMKIFSNDLYAFKRKANELADLGIDGIVIAFDDYFARKEADAKQHTQFANKIAEELSKRGIHMYLIPSQYSGITSYHATLGENLDSRIQVGWTGREIVSSKIMREDVKALEAMLGRKPFLGHNFPVVNETDKKRRIHLGPLKGLDSNLAEYLSGIAFNFMPLPFASLISGLTCADYAWNPKDYHPERAIKNSCNALGGIDLLDLVRLNPETTADPNAIHPITRLLVKGIAHRQLSTISYSEREQLRDAFRTMSSLEYNLLPPKVDPRLYRELYPLLYQANMLGGLGEAIVNGTIKNLNFFSKGMAAIKMVAGYRFSGLEIENWILREMGFPASFVSHTRSLWDIIDRIYRKRHRKQKI